MNLLRRFISAHFSNINRFVLNRQWGLCLILLFVVGCGQLDKATQQSTTPLPATLSNLVTATITAPIRVTSTPQPTKTATPTEIPTIHPTTIQPTPLPTPEVISLSWSGQYLIYYDGDGIYRFSLETGTSQLIVPILNQGTVWISHAEPVFNGQEIVYWYVEGEWFIVKVVNGFTGQDRPLLVIENDGFTTARGSWLGQGHFFELAIWGEDEDGIPFVKQWYLFDVINDTVVGNADGTPGTKVCYALAISPRSNRIATWCSFDGQFNEEGNYIGQGEYHVVETNGGYWVTTTPPDQVLVETFGINQKHNWSPNGNYVLLPGGLNATLIDVEDSQVYELFEEDDTYLNIYDAQFSPDGRFLSYEYQICQFDNFCQRILDLKTGSIVWDSSGLFEAPAHFFTWSPDGSYFILRLSNGDYNIIETQGFSIVKSIAKDALSNAVEMVWLDQSDN